jgi:RNA polymerase sigma factor (sigma-70 family)
MLANRQLYVRLSLGALPMSNYCQPCCPIDGFVYPEAKKLNDTAAESPDQFLHSCSKCSRSFLIERQLELSGSVSSPTLNTHAPIDLDQLVASLLPNINDAVRWAYLQYQGRICLDELRDLSQQIILMLIEDNCRRLRLFSGQSSFKTWLQVVVNHHIHKYFYRRTQIEILDDVDQESLTYLPLQDQAIDIAEKQKLLFNALSRLNRQERLLYQLWFISELDAKEIAAILGTKVKIIYKRKQTLILKLRRLLRKFHSH